MKEWMTQIHMTEPHREWYSVDGKPFHSKLYMSVASAVAASENLLELDS